MRKFYMGVALLFFCAIISLNAQRKESQSILIQNSQIERDLTNASTSVLTKESFDFSKADLDKINKIVKELTAAGYSTEEATNSAVQQVAFGNPTTVRIAHYADRATVPSDSSLWIDRDSTIHTYTPTEIVRKVLLKSYTSEDEARIQNVDFLGFNWSRSLQAWTHNSYDPSNFDGQYGWHNDGITNTEDRSLVYFQRGPAVDSVNFDFPKGVLLASGPTYTIEGPYTTYVGMVNGGYTNQETWGDHTGTLGGSFDQDLQNLTNQLMSSYGSGTSACGSILEFDFQPAIDSVSFDYIFACDEYPAINSLFDVFGFFVTGPYDTPSGSGGTLTTALPSEAKSYNKTNIATLPPGSTGNIVTILNINYQTNPNLFRNVGDFRSFASAINSAGGINNYFTTLGYTYPDDTTTFMTVKALPSLSTTTHIVTFKDFIDGINRIKMIEYGGYSTKLTATADSLIPGKWYRLKLGLSQTNSCSGGTGIFLTNLDLGNAGGSAYIPYVGVPSIDAMGPNYIYRDCPCDMKLTFDASSAANKKSVVVKCLGMPSSALLNEDGEKLFPSDTFKLTGLADTLLTYKYKVSPDFEGYKSGQYVGLYVSILGGGGDTVFYQQLWDTLSWDVKYTMMDEVNKGSLNLNVKGATPYLYWRLAGFGSCDTCYYKPVSAGFTQSDLLKIGEYADIELYQPLTCHKDTIKIRTETGEQEIYRYINIPSVFGVTTEPTVGKHYVEGHKDFSFTALYDGDPMTVKAKGYYSGTTKTLEGTLQDDGSYKYTIRQVVEPWDISFAASTNSGDVSNKTISNKTVWSSGSTLYINTQSNCKASIYTLLGAIYKQIDVNGSAAIQLPRGFYIVSVNNTQYKVIIK